MTTPTGVGVRWEAHADLVVVGGGVAGLTAARAAARRGLTVLTLSKGGPTDTSTQYAQGGIAVVAPTGDSVDSHVADTLAAGGGLCDEEAVRSIVSVSMFLPRANSSVPAAATSRMDDWTRRGP